MDTQRIWLPRVSIAAILLLAWISTADAQAADSKPKPTGSISGRVTVGGKSAVGIPVVAYGGENLNRRLPAAKSKTDSEGRYRLNGLPSGQYQIAVLSPELTNSETSSDYGFFFSSSSKSIFLAAAEDVEDIDLKLVRGGVITGRVTDADNRPVVEQRVTLEPLVETGRPPNRVPYSAGQMSLTDDRGVYRIYGLPAGRYKVAIGMNAGEVMAGSRAYFQKTYHPDVTDPSRSPIIELAEGSEAANIDVRVGRREETFSVAGIVVDSETGTPVTGALIGFSARQKGETRFYPFTGGLATADGKFKMGGFSPGRYGAFVSNDNERGKFYSDPVYFEIVDKDVTDVQIRAVPGLTMSGVIENESGTLKDLLAQLPGLRVTAHVGPPSGRIDVETMFLPSGMAIVMSDGSFQIEGLRPGRASLEVYAPGGTKRPAVVKIEHGGLGLAQGFDIQPGRSVSGLRVILAYGTGAIRGTVKYEGGTPPEGARTFISCLREGTRTQAGGGQVDARGHFVMRGLPPGTYEVMLHVQVPMVTPGGTRSRPPQKQFVNVINDTEAEVTFVVNLAPKEGGP